MSQMTSFVNAPKAEKKIASKVVDIGEHYGSEIDGKAKAVMGVGKKMR